MRMVAGTLHELGDAQRAHPMCATSAASTVKITAAMASDLRFARHRATGLAEKPTVVPEQ
jgi:hypothetical protein